MTYEISYEQDGCEEDELKCQICNSEITYFEYDCMLGCCERCHNQTLGA